MDDIDTIAQQLRDGAEQRGLRIIEALYPGDPAAILDYESTSVEEVLEIAQASFAPFVSVTVLPFELDDELTVDEDEEDHAPELAAEIRRFAADHAGESRSVMLEWLAGGSLFAYYAIADWSHEIGRLIDEWKSANAVDYRDLWQARRARITHLADQLEGDPAYRAANNQQRRALGKSLLEPLLGSDDDGATAAHALDEAGRTVRENAAVAYAGLPDLDTLAAELHELDDWTWANVAGDRTKVARAFLLGRAEGYAPSTQLVEDLRRAAEKLR